MIGLLLAAALLQTVSPCNAVEPAGPRPADCPAWQPLVSNEDGMVLVDHTSLRRDGAAFEIELRTIFPGGETGPVRSANSRMRFDCAARTAVVRYLTGFDARGTQLAAGAPSGEMAVPRPIPPGTPTEILLTRYCT